MISKAQVKLINSLHQKKYRKEHKLFVAEGAKLAEELLHSALQIAKIYALDTWISLQNQALHQRFEGKLFEVTAAEMKQISSLVTPQEVLMLVEEPEQQDYHNRNGRIRLAVESIRDPGNLGTIIRLADWYAIPDLFCSTDCVDAFNTKVVQASMGSIARVNIVYTPLDELFDELGLPVYAAVLDGETDIHHLQSYDVALLLIGNESQGVSSGLMKKVSYTVRIPRFGMAESLNAAMATGILLDNFKRLEKSSSPG